MDCTVRAPQVEKSYSCQYLQTAQYRASCKQGAMPVLDSWYRAEGWHGTNIVQPKSWDQVSANNWLQSNASTEPVQISVLAWYRCPVPREYRWKTSSQVTFWSRPSVRLCLCQNYASTANSTEILAQYQAGCKFLPGTSRRIQWYVTQSGISRKVFGVFSCIIK